MLFRVMGYAILFAVVKEVVDLFEDETTTR